MKPKKHVTKHELMWKIQQHVFSCIYWAKVAYNKKQYDEYFHQRSTAMTLSHLFIDILNEETEWHLITDAIDLAIGK